MPKKDQKVSIPMEDMDSQRSGSEETSKKKGCCGSKDKEKIRTIGLFRILSLTPESYWIMAVGSFFSLVYGMTFPMFSLIFGDMFNVFYDTTLDRYAEIRKYALIFFGIGLASFVCAYLMSTCWGIVGERIAKKLRMRFFTAVLEQEPGFFDVQQSGRLYLTKWNDS